MPLPPRLGHRPGLEDALWHEDESGRKTVWKKRNVSTQRIEALIAERASTTVEAALIDVLEGHAPAGKGKKRRSRS